MAPPNFKKLKLVYVAIGDIKVYDKNPRDNSTAVEAVKASLSEFGFRVPIVLDKDNVLIAGHTRFAAAQDLGFDELPAFIAADLTPEQVQAFRVIDNKTAELANWDFDLLAGEVAGLLDAGIDLTQFGFGHEELDCLREVVASDALDTPPEVEPAENGAGHVSGDASQVRVAIGEFRFYISIEAYRAWAHGVRADNGHDNTRIMFDLAARLNMREEYEAFNAAGKKKDAPKTITRKIGEPLPPAGQITSSPGPTPRVRTRTRS